MKLWPRLLLVSLLYQPLPAQQAWTVTADEQWNACFRREHGWNGADGAYSVGLEGGWTGWVFSDTFVGPVQKDGSRAGNRFLHNSWARIHGKRPLVAEFGIRELAHSEGNTWFWVYQPFLNRERQGYLFLGEFATSPNGPEGLNFRQVGTRLARLDWSGWAPKLTSLTSVPHFRADPPVNFGAAVLSDNFWTYLYGTRDFGARKEVLLARAPIGRLEQFDSWQFWPQWGSRVEEAQPLLKEASNELSVFYHKQEVRLLTQVGDEIRLYRAASPQGPVQESVVLCKLPREDFVWPYNAKAHPELGWPLLITYNRNALPPELVLRQADRYRPRCLRLSQDPWLP